MQSVSPEPIEILVTVNGVARRHLVEPRLTLVDFLRETLGLTGTHIGCEHGVCGACSVLLDGDPVRACCVFAAQADGLSVTTVEGLSPGRGALSALQDAFCEKHALQCGFCTPGMLVAAHDLLRRNPHPGEDEIRQAISGNLCRCNGYHQIVDAVTHAAQHADPAGSAAQVASIGATAKDKA